MFLVLLVSSAAFSLATMVARFQGVQPLLGLDAAMPLGWAPRNDLWLSRVFGHAPLATDDELQFPSPPTRKPRTLQVAEWSSTSARKPDVLMVVFESLRPDALLSMPRLSAFGSESVRFNEHYSAGNCTLVGVFSLLSGLDPTYLGGERTAFAPSGLGALQALGYEIVISDGATLNFRLETLVLPNGTKHIGPSRNGAADERDRENTEWAVDWAKAESDKPRALVLFLERTHWPYLVDGEPAPRTNAFDSWSLRNGVADIKARYERAAAQSDEAFGRVLDALEHAGRLSSTVVIATGDHGEAFREHGVLMHGSRVDDEQVQVPLFMRLPGVDARDVAGPTVHQDVLPTLLGYLGATLRTGPGTGVDRFGEWPVGHLPVVGSCGIANAVGYAAILEDRKLLYQLEDNGLRYVSDSDRNDVPLGRAMQPERDLPVLDRLYEQATALWTTPGDVQRQAQLP